MEKNKKFKGFWKYMIKYIKPHTCKLLFTAVASMFVGAFVAIQPLIIKWIVDDGITNSALVNSEKLQFVIKMCILYLAVSLCRIGFWAMAYLNILKILENVIFSLRSDFYARVQRMHMKNYEKKSVGELFNCIMGSPIINIKTFLSSICLNVPYQAVSLIVSLIALSSYDIVLTAILFVTAASMALINFFARKQVRTAHREYIKTEAEASHHLNDSLQGMEAIKIYSIEEKQMQTFKGFITNMYKAGLKASLRQYLASVGSEFVNYLGTAIVYLVGAVTCIYRGLSIGVLYAFLSSMGNILVVLASWLSLNIQKTSAEAGIHKIMEIMVENSESPETDTANKRNITEARNLAKSQGLPCIELDNVDFSYENKEIFKKLSCQIKYNESIALVGESGSGKSTLIKLLMRLYDIKGGTLKFHGHDIKEYNSHDLRVTFGVVPQSPFIFYGTIWDNILIARPDASNRDVIKAMEIAHVHEFVNDLEHGWNTMVGDGALGLSGGQKQRIAIARAVLGDPDILIFDEATSALDNISERHIQQAMEELMKDHTVIIVAHRLSTIKNVDRIMVFEKGRIIQEGKYNELAEADGTFKKLLNAQ